jgi:hypothetical protein
MDIHDDRLPDGGPESTIPLKFDPAYHSPEWQGLVARCIGVEREAVEEFVNGILLAALLGAAGGGVLCEVTFTIPQELDLKLRLPTKLYAGVDLFYPELDDPVAEMVQEAREERTGTAFIAAREMQGLTKRQRGRFQIRYAWRPVERGEFEERWEGV